MTKDLSAGALLPSTAGGTPNNPTTASSDERNSAHRNYRPGQPIQPMCRRCEDIGLMRFVECRTLILNGQAYRGHCYQCYHARLVCHGLQVRSATASASSSPSVNVPAEARTSAVGPTVTTTHSGGTSGIVVLLPRLEDIIQRKRRAEQSPSPEQGSNSGVRWTIPARRKVAKTAGPATTPCPARGKPTGRTIPKVEMDEALMEGLLSLSLAPGEPGASSALPITLVEESVEPFSTFRRFGTPGLPYTERGDLGDLAAQRHTVSPHPDNLYQADDLSEDDHPIDRTNFTSSQEPAVVPGFVRRRTVRDILHDMRARVRSDISLTALFEPLIVDVYQADKDASISTGEH